MSLLGHLDDASRQLIRGWAWDPDNPHETVSLVISANDNVIGRTYANLYRPDLEAIGIPNGRAGFEIVVDHLLSAFERYVITVRREGDGKHIVNSPIELSAPTMLDPETQAAMSRLLLAVGDGDAEFDARLGFLAEQTESLLRHRATSRAGPNEREARRRLAWRQSDVPANVVRQALVVDDRMPVTGRDAGSNAIMSHMRSLGRLGYAVSFVPADVQGDSGALEAMGITCLSRPWYDSVEAVLARQPGAFALVYLHRHASAWRYATLVRDHQPKARLVYGIADLHWLRLSRQAAIEDRPELAAATERLKARERFCCAIADTVITHSSFEAELMRELLPVDKVRVVPWEVPLQATEIPFDRRAGVAFIGNYAHAPNVDAANFLVDRVMPAVRALDPSIRCLLAGGDMPARLRRSAADNVEVVGAVPELRAIFDRVRLTVAPLAFGAGIKGKVLDSLAAGIPCVCTPMAAEGLELPQILLDQVSADPGGLALSIARLHQDQDLNDRCAAAGLAHVAAFASAERVDALLGQATNPAAPS